MLDSIFIGREDELERLDFLYDRKMPSIAVIKGRRRVGKSRLVREFVKRSGSPIFWNFSGIAPEGGVSAQDQRDEFARQLAGILNTPYMTFHDWSDAFAYLGHYVKPGDVILFDEISWMGSKDPKFIPKLKVWWDIQTKHMLLVFCGSVSTWIEDNILKSASFFGRISLVISLKPLSIPKSAALIRKIGMNVSPYDMYRILGVIGGIPWYMYQFSSKMTVDENIKRLAFVEDGLLITEFDRVFHDLFNGKGSVYKKALEALKNGSRTLAEIRSIINFSHSGTLSQIMEHLIIAGFVVKQPLWSFKTAKISKQSLYRISDPYMRFYLKVIAPNLGDILSAEFDKMPISALPGIDVHMGLQLELLLMQNRNLLLQKLGISPIDVVRSGPYRQNKTTSQPGCQIDYLVHTKTNTLFVCEFKFKNAKIKSDIINEMQEKLARLKVPKNFSKVPVLFHVSEVSSQVELSSYFYRIIDIADFLESE